MTALFSETCNAQRKTTFATELNIFALFAQNFIKFTHNLSNRADRQTIQPTDAKLDIVIVPYERRLTDYTGWPEK